MPSCRHAPLGISSTINFACQLTMLSTLTYLDKSALNRQELSISAAQADSLTLCGNKNITLSLCSFYYLLLLLQICIFSASFISSSRKSGCATEIMASHFCQADRPFKFTLPYSVTSFRRRNQENVRLYRRQPRAVKRAGKLHQGYPLYFRTG